MDVKGKVKVIGETVAFGSNGFTKREVVVTTAEQYPQDIMMEFVKDKCALLDKFAVGDNVAISINLRGRGWVNPEGVSKYFNSLQGWRIVKDGEAAGTNTPPASQEDDVPF